MKREILITSDGSTTIHLPDWDEQYHSKNGSINETYHVFIKNGLKQISSDKVSILEIGFGTGLNCFITYLASKKQIDGTFEYYVMESMTCRGSKSAQFSQKAFEIDPNRSETHEGLLIHYITTFESEKAKSVATRMLANNHFSNSNLKWNYNSLQTAEINGVLITHGDLDAIPKWVLQYGNDKYVRNYSVR